MSEYCTRSATGSQHAGVFTLRGANSWQSQPHRDDPPARRPGRDRPASRQASRPPASHSPRGIRGAADVGPTATSHRRSPRPASCPATRNRAATCAAGRTGIHGPAAASPLPGTGAQTQPRGDSGPPGEGCPPGAWKPSAQGQEAPWGARAGGRVRTCVSSPGGRCAAIAPPPRSVVVTVYAPGGRSCNLAVSLGALGALWHSIPDPPHRLAVQPREHGHTHHRPIAPQRLARKAPQIHAGAGLPVRRRGHPRCQRVVVQGTCSAIHTDTIMTIMTPSSP